MMRTGNRQNLTGSRQDRGRDEIRRRPGFRLRHEISTAANASCQLSPNTDPDSDDVHSRTQAEERRCGALVRVAAEPTSR